MSTEAEEASKVLATEQEFWNGRSSNQEEDAHEDIPDIRGRGCLRLSSRTVLASTWLTKTAQ
jgi:hypothetical protein